MNHPDLLIMNLNSMQLAFNIINAFKERNSCAIEWDDFVCQWYADQSLVHLNKLLYTERFSSWFNLGTSYFNELILLNVGTYCSDCSWDHLFSFIENSGRVVVPASEEFYAIAFSKPFSVTHDGNLRLSEIGLGKASPSVIAWLLATQAECPILDLCKDDLIALDDIVAQMLSWILTRDNFDSTMDPYLLAWAKRPGKVAFWAILGLILRRPHYHDQGKRPVSLSLTSSVFV